MMGSRPFGLGGCSKVVKPLSLNRCTHSYTKVTLQPTRSAASATEQARATSAITRYRPWSRTASRRSLTFARSTRCSARVSFSAWTVPKLGAYCRQRGLLPPITDEWVRRLLRREGLRAQRIRTWKTSDDPAFDRKKNASASSTGRARRGQR
jgi:hypothetical protein